jgi:hypothetical protein
MLDVVHHEYEFYGIDPLMDEYLKIIPEINNNNPIRWIKGRGEELDNYIDCPVHIIFALNSLDHSENIEQCLHSIEKCLIPDGTTIISLNCHSIEATAYLFSTLKLDKLHHFHMTKNHCCPVDDT